MESTGEVEQMEQRQENSRLLENSAQELQKKKLDLKKRELKLEFERKMLELEKEELELLETRCRRKQPDRSESAIVQVVKSAQCMHACTQNDDDEWQQQEYGEPSVPKRRAQPKPVVQDSPVTPVFGECDVCGRQFRWPSARRRHRFLHTPKSEWTFACNECPQRFYLSARLKDHRRRCHADGGFACNWCTAKCATRKGLLSHARKKHPQLKNLSVRSSDSPNTTAGDELESVTASLLDSN